MLQLSPAVVTKCLGMFLGACLVMNASSLCGQSLFSPRAVALGAYGAMVTDVRGFDRNPSGLVNIRDWDLLASTYTSTSGGEDGFVFHGLSIGKRFFERHAFAVQYAPGSLLQFSIPASVVLIDSIPVSVDQKAAYDEQLAFGLGIRVGEALFAGAGGHLRGEKVTDTQYELKESDTLNIITSTEKITKANTWLFDVALMWGPLPDITVSAVGRNLFFAGEELPAEYEALRLPRKAAGEFGVSYRPSGIVKMSGEYSTRNWGALGVEWMPLIDLAVRGGMYIDGNKPAPVSAAAFGVGWSFEFVDVDAAYLYFPDKKQRTASFSASAFNPSVISSVDLNPYTRDRLSLSIKTKLGATRESLLRIESVEIAEAIYPVALEAFAYRPVGKVHVRNISSRPLYARAGFMVEKYMDDPTETAAVFLEPGQEKEIPLNAVFNESMKNVTKAVIRDGTVYVSTTPAEEYDDKFQTRVLIHGRNDWNGDVLSLRYFVAPNDPEVIRYSRDVLIQSRDSIDVVPRDMQAFWKARVLLDDFAGKLTYVSDPKQTAEYVQYPAETLRLGGGDCDDMAVCFSSLLNSVGISTAFVDVVPPDRPEESHIYILFDTGIETRYGINVSPNPKRYVARNNTKGVETIWIPIETTVINRGFEEAWSSGAQQYFDDVEIGLGLVKRWVKIVDVY